MQVITFTEPGLASVNSYVVSAGEGVIVIDAQRSLSLARKFQAVIAQTGKPVLAIFLTHPHPDHLGGLPILAKAYPDAPIYALQITRDTIETDALGYGKMSKKVLGDDFDEAIPLPNRIVATGDTLAIGNLRLQVEDAGEGEAPCMMTLFLPDEDALFCADVVQHQMTAFLIESRSAAWLEQVNRAAAQYGAAGTVYPGHGPSGSGSALFGYQKEYLETFRQLVAGQRQADGSVSESGRQIITAAMNRKYPGYLPVAVMPDLLEKDVDAIAREMQAAPQPKPPA